MKNKNTQIQEAGRSPEQNKNKVVPKYITVKLNNAREKKS